MVSATCWGHVELRRMGELDLYRNGELLFLSFFAAYLAWLGLFAYVILTRAIHDARNRSVRRLEALLRPAGADGLSDTERERAVAEAWARIPRKRLEEVAADAATPEWFAQSLSRFAFSQRSTELLAEAAGHENERTKWRRVAALQILARAQAAPALPLLRAAATDADPDVAGAAVRTLGRMDDPAAAEILVTILRRRSHSPAQVAARLDAFAFDVPETIRPLLKERDPSIRFWGATLIARYSELGGLAVELAGLTQDDDPSVRAAALETLGRMRGDVALRAAVGALADPVPFVRAHAARALGDLDAIQTAPLVATLLADRDWWVRSAAKATLAVFGPRVAPSVRLILDHPDAFARNGAAEVLQELGWLDELLVSALREAVPSEKTALLSKVIAAGGFGFVTAAARRVEAEEPDVGLVIERLRPAAASGVM